MVVRKQEVGLTLLELLIALAIFSLVSLMSYGGVKEERGLQIA